MSKLEKQRATAKWILLVLLVYCLVIAALTYLLPDSLTVAFLSPFTVLAVFLEQWSADSTAIFVISRGLVCLHAVLPLIGWLLLCKPIQAGRALIIAPFSLLIASNLFITFNHLITAIGTKNSAFMEPTKQYVSYTLRLGAISLVISIAVLVAVNIWRPKNT